MEREFRTMATGHAKKSRHESLVSVANDGLLTVTEVSHVCLCVSLCMWRGIVMMIRAKIGKLSGD